MFEWSDWSDERIFLMFFGFDWRFFFAIFSSFLDGFMTGEPGNFGILLLSLLLLLLFAVGGATGFGFTEGGRGEIGNTPVPVPVPGVIFIFPGNVPFFDAGVVVAVTVVFFVSGISGSASVLSVIIFSIVGFLIFP